MNKQPNPVFLISVYMHKLLASWGMKWHSLKRIRPIGLQVALTIGRLVSLKILCLHIWFSIVFIVFDSDRPTWFENEVQNEYSWLPINE